MYPTNNKRRVEGCGIHKKLLIIRVLGSLFFCFCPLTSGPSHLTIMSNTRRTLWILLILGFVTSSYSQYYVANQEQSRYYYVPQQPQYQQWQPAQLYASQAAYSNYPQHQQQFYAPRPQAPTAVQAPFQQIPSQVPRQQYVAEKKLATQNRAASNVYEFDLPPAPPSRFLSEDDRSKILSLSKTGRLEHVGVVASISQQRTRLVGGATDRQIQHTRAPVDSPQVQSHHLQVPRFIPRPAVQTPSQITHMFANPPSSPVLTTRPILTNVGQTVETTTFGITISHLSHGKGVDPNKIFLQCCQNKKVAKVCESKCSFSGINKKALTAMFLGTDPCPQRYGLDLFSCAAQENDHSACCRSKNVQRTSAGAKCLAFCNLRPDSRFKADASYLPCWGVLHDVKDCFREAIINGGEM